MIMILLIQEEMSKMIRFLPNLLLIIGFVSIHMTSKFLSFKKIPLRTFLSYSGGVGIAYVFLHLLPDLPHTQENLNEAINWNPEFLPMNYTSYMIALLGLSIFYVMDRIVIKAWENEEITNPDQLESKIFWAHMGFFSLYNGMIGYLLAVEPFEEILQAVLFFMAFGLHFITNDWSLRHHHENIYDSHGRKILAYSIFFGWVIGMLLDLAEIHIRLVEAFVTGAMMMNVIKEELPSEREGSLHGFLSGIFTASLLFWFL